MKKVEQVVEKFDDVVGGHDSQQDVVRSGHRWPAEDPERQRVAGQSDDADDRIDDEPGDETRRLVELDVRRRRLGGRREVTRGRDVIIHRDQQVPAGPGVAT